MDEAVRRWRQKGEVYCWFELDRGQGDGWHLAADKLGCESLYGMAALALASKFPSRFSIVLSRGKGANPRCPTKLMISHRAEWSDSHWRIGEFEDDITLELGTERLVEFQQMIPKLEKGYFNDIRFPEDVDLDEAFWI